MNYLVCGAVLNLHNCCAIVFGYAQFKWSKNIGQVREMFPGAEVAIAYDTPCALRETIWLMSRSIPHEHGKLVESRYIDEDLYDDDCAR